MILALILTVFNNIYSQLYPSIFQNKDWKIKKIYSQFMGKTFIQYDKEISTNTVDYSTIKYTFYGDGTYNLYRNDSVYSQSSWMVNSKLDSLYIDKIPRKLIQYDNNSILMRTSSLQFADTSAKLDTMYTFFELYNSKDIITSNQDLTITSFKIYPNPINKGEELIIENISNSNEYKLSLYNSIGTLILEKIQDEKLIKIKINSFQKGIYILKLSDINGSFSKFERIISE